MEGVVLRDITSPRGVHGGRQRSEAMFWSFAWFLPLADIFVRKTWEGETNILEVVEIQDVIFYFGGPVKKMKEVLKGSYYSSIFRPYSFSNGLQMIVLEGI